MDGTLVDTEPYWMRAETEIVESFGGVWTHADCMLMVGSALTDAAGILQSRGVDLGADDIVGKLTDRVQEQLREHGVPWRPGARELLRLVKNAGIPMGLVTMSISRMAHQVSDLVGFDAFDTIVTGDMVAEGKPHPEAYLSAAGLLGVNVLHCLAVEDSVPGVASAVAAGTVTIGVPHMIPLAESPLYDLWPTLAGQSVADLHSVYAARRPQTHLTPAPTAKDTEPA
jgi:HAD superfamily hydrolase (TIGR01509 family)